MKLDNTTLPNFEVPPPTRWGSWCEKSWRFWKTLEKMMRLKGGKQQDWDGGLNEVFKVWEQVDDGLFEEGSYVESLYMILL